MTDKQDEIIILLKEILKKLDEIDSSIQLVYTK